MGEVFGHAPVAGLPGGLNFIIDDYLNSSLTGNKYEATGKRSIASAVPVAKRAGG